MTRPKGIEGKTGSRWLQSFPKVQFPYLASTGGDGCKQAELERSFNSAHVRLSLESVIPTMPAVDG